MNQADWLFSETKPVRGVALSVHGLNAKPSSMEAIASILRAQGFDVLRVALSGHRGVPGEMKTVNREGWLTEVESAHAIARARAEELHVPFVGLGYSLGGVLLEDLINTREARFDSLILFVPALAIRPRAHILRAFRVFGRGFSLPALTPAKYRANDRTSIAAYAALFASTRAVRRSRFLHLHLPTLVFLSRGDELVDSRQIERDVRRFHLTNWRMVWVDNSGATLEPKYGHLMLEEECVGTTEWGRITREMLRVLRV